MSVHTSTLPGTGAGAGAVQRVLVAHGESMVRRSIAERMSRHGVAAIVEAASTTEVRDLARSPGPRDLAVIGLGPDMDLIAAIGHLVDRGWSHVVVLVPPGQGMPAVEAALAAGATGVLIAGAAHRNTPWTSLRLATDQQPQNGGPASATHLVVDVGGIARALSARELQILQLTANGCGNQEIAAHLGLSPLTVKSHLSRIGRRLGTGDRAHMVLLALRAGVIA